MQYEDIKSKNARFILGEFRWDVATQFLFPQSGDGEDLIDEGKRLTKKQQALLLCLLNEEAKPLSREKIISTVWGNQHISPESLPQLINRTRAILGDEEKRIIENHPGIGYSLNVVIQELSTDTEIEKKEKQHDIFESEFYNPTSEKSFEWSFVDVALSLLIAMTFINLFTFYDSFSTRKEFDSMFNAERYSEVREGDFTNELIVTIDGVECSYEKGTQTLYCP
ncbi:invasion protein regulator [Grimontia celer]|uniref:Invasion protein regulator n=1 Tax=Grimontia celer TaxID=1796497 RepID=A0A128EX52_9GAMM|nr:winged helix-turn-helix domain-containing protein [Grimontia celer]CZF78586.1 invasion protein regulator [Grimontia celer]